jgi:hypothetical protein
MATRIAAEFTLTGVSFDPEQVIRELGIQPTKTWRLGDQIQKTLLHYKHDGWMLSTGYQTLDEEHAVNLTGLIRELFLKLKPHTKALVGISAKLNLEAELTCIMYIEGDCRPEMHLDRDVVQWLGELHADIDTDIYILPQERER